ncbi:MAG: acyltransferase [Bacteroidales bacterium]|nr:acyltransferase [Bacteroidales bacterium]
MTDKKVLSRNSNLELYRVILMLLIIAHHYVVNSPLMNVIVENPTSKESIFLWLFGMWGKTGINCFLMITGYFMCCQQITLRKFLKLFFEVLFYNIVIYCIFVLFGYQEVSLKNIFHVIVPIRYIRDGFISCFLVFYLFIPFLNILIKNMNKKEHALLILLCVVMYSMFGTLPGFGVSMNYVSWFCVVYFIASYIRLYGLLDKITHSQWGWVTLLFVVLSMLSAIGLIFINKFPYHLVNINGPMAIIVAVSSFMYFKDLKIRQSAFINALGASTFGVLVIHGNSDTMRTWLWKDTLDNLSYYSSSFLILHAIVAVLAVYIVCTAIDYVRIKVIEKPLFNYLDKNLFSKNH